LTPRPGDAKVVLRLSMVIDTHDEAQTRQGIDCRVDAQIGDKQ
jgi:hypothetical protein